MQTKRDQLQAHNFVVGRLKSAVLRGDADAAETPTRRFTAAGFAGLLIAALLVAGCGVFGLVFPGGNRAWRQPGTIVVEEGTGTRYVLLDGVLRPVLNIASARLLVGAQARLRSVSTESLRGVPHGLPIGIPGAPDTLPRPGDLTGAPWLVCATTSTGVSGAPRPTVTVRVAGGDPGEPLPADVAVPVVTPGGAAYLAWGDRRLRVDRTALVALGISDARPLMVAAAWLNALPPGPDLRPPPIPRRGAAGPAMDGRPTRVGQIVAVDSPIGGRDFYAVLGDGLATVSPVVAALLLADPQSRAAYPGQSVRPVVVGANAVAAAPRSAAGSPGPPGLPPTEPHPWNPAGAARQVPCGRHAVGATPSVRLVLTDDTGTAADAARPTTDPLVADRVVVAPGRGVLAAAQPAPGLSGQALYLVTDVGVKYPLVSPAAAAALGYGAVAPVDVPAALLAFLPTGPVLDPAVAGTVYTAPPATSW